MRTYACRSRADVARLWIAQQGRCFYCGCLLDPERGAGNGDYWAERERLFRRFTRDHFIPLAHGGPDDWFNIVLACVVCNYDKDDTPPSAAERARFTLLVRFGRCEPPPDRRPGQAARPGGAVHAAMLAAVARAAAEGRVFTTGREA